MKSSLLYAALAVTVLGLVLAASARDVALPAGTLIQCTLNEPNFSSATADIGDPVLCHLRGVTEFGQQAFPRGSYLVGHLEAAKDPGHFVGKGSLKLQFDRIGLPSGDLPLVAKVIAMRGYRVDREGKIIGHGHATRDVVEWMLPPLWPWKVIMLPARGPRPKLKGETTLTLRLMDDVLVPQVAATNDPGWHFFGTPQSQSYRESQYSDARPILAVREISSGQLRAEAVPQASYAVYREAESPARVNPESYDQKGSSLNTPPGAPVFVLKTGATFAVGNYVYHNGRITYALAGGGSGVISTDEVDWSATTHLNAVRGVRVTLHTGHIGSEAPGY